MPNDTIGSVASSKPTRRAALKAGTAAALLAPFASRSPAFAAEKTIKIGFVSPKTGPIAAFGEADDYVLANARKALAGGITVGGKTHPVEILARDSQSNSNRAAEVASALINTDQVDLMLASSTSDTTNPVSDQCEVNGVPCITTDTPWQAWYFGRGGKPTQGFDWTYHFFWGLEDIIDVYSGMWKSLPTNKVIGGLWSDDPDGAAFSDPQNGMPVALRKMGFTVVDAGKFNPLADEFSAQISKFKEAKVEILTGVFLPPTFATFWAQAAQQQFRPKIATVAKALLFPSAIQAIGARGAGLSTEVWWSPTYPYKSGLTGETAAQFVAGYEQASKKPWVQPLGFKHAVIEVACDVLKRSKSLDPKDIRDAIVATDYQSLVGRVGWKSGPVKNVAKTPLTGGQWRAKQGGGFDLIVVNNGEAKELPVGGHLEPLPGA
jgi:branched-chain amino acid transport system substrate-binding protein